MLKKSLSLLDRSVEIVIVVIFAAMVIVGGMQVFNRSLLNESLSWSEEFQKYAHIWLIFLAIPVGYRRGAHIGMSMFARKFPINVQFALTMLTDLLWLVFAGAIIIYTTVIMHAAKGQLSAGLGLRMDRVYLGLLLGGAYLAIVVLRRAGEHISEVRSGRFKGLEP